MKKKKKKKKKKKNLFKKNDKINIKKFNNDYFFFSNLVF